MREDFDKQLKKINQDKALLEEKYDTLKTSSRQL